MDGWQKDFFMLERAHSSTHVDVANTLMNDTSQILSDHPTVFSLKKKVILRQLPSSSMLSIGTTEWISLGNKCGIKPGAAAEPKDRIHATVIDQLTRWCCHVSHVRPVETKLTNLLVTTWCLNTIIDDLIHSILWHLSRVSVELWIMHFGKGKSCDSWGGGPFRRVKGRKALVGNEALRSSVFISRKSNVIQCNCMFCSDRERGGRVQ